MFHSERQIANEHIDTAVCKRQTPTVPTQPLHPSQACRWGARITGGGLSTDELPVSSSLLDALRIDISSNEEAVRIGKGPFYGNGADAAVKQREVSSISTAQLGWGSWVGLQCTACICVSGLIWSDVCMAYHMGSHIVKSVWPLTSPAAIQSR